MNDREITGTRSLPSWDSGGSLASLYFCGNQTYNRSGHFPRKHSRVKQSLVYWIGCPSGWRKVIGVVAKLTWRWLLTWYMVRPSTPITLNTPFGVASASHCEKTALVHHPIIIAHNYTQFHPYMWNIKLTEVLLAVVRSAIRIRHECHFFPSTLEYIRKFFICQQPKSKNERPGLFPLLSLKSKYRWY